MDKPNIALIGMGLIGSSIGHALKAKGLAAHVAGYARSAPTRVKALEIGFVDSIHDTPKRRAATPILCFSTRR